MNPAAEIKKAIATYAARSVEQRSRWYAPAAEAYAATRPRYPQPIIDAVVARAGLTAASSVLEVGCGPGTATEAFAELGCRILAIEPNPEFCRLAQKACERFSNVEVATTSLEEWDVKQGCFQAVVAASSFHWIPPEIAYPKAAQALKANGWLILLWNKELQLQASTHEALRPIVCRHAPQLDRAYEDAGTVARILDVLGQPLEDSPLFQGVQRGQILVERSLSIDDYLTLQTTYSPFLALDPDVRTALTSELRQALQQIHGNTVPLTYTSAYQMAQRVQGG
ncbi:MAG: class I SAM-dependent methyltransferase [Synechococcaceae cyanobacterium ELA445]